MRVNPVVSELGVRYSNRRIAIVSLLLISLLCGSSVSPSSLLSNATVTPIHQTNIIFQTILGGQLPMLIETLLKNFTLVSRSGLHHFP